MTWADGPLLAFDLETTGTDPMTALPVSFCLVYATGETVWKGRTGLIDPGVPIPEDARAVHGITDEMVQEKGGGLEDSVIGIAGELIRANVNDWPLVTMNGSYDLTVLDQCIKRTYGDGLRAMGWKGDVIDIRSLDQIVDRYRPGSRNLAALAHQYGVLMGDAHDAAADATATLHIAREIAAEYGWVGKMDTTALHVMQQKQRGEWAVEFAQYRAEKGQPPLEEWAGDWPIVGESYDRAIKEGLG